MFEIGGVNEKEAREALRLAAYKLPIKCKVISKEAKGE
jgi:large subunit ribosomal protein L16